MKKSTIEIKQVTRIEGHASVKIDINQNKEVISAKLIVKELRGFEKILEKMKVVEMPMVTARICGVCPAAHHIVSAKALDRAFGVKPAEAGKMIRELMYMGHIIHSHTMSLFFLSGPDLIMGIDSDPSKRNIIGMSKVYPDIVKQAIELRSMGQKFLEQLGARGVHPVTATAGGVSFSLKDSLRSKLLKDAAKMLKLATSFALPIIKKKLDDFINDYPELVNQMEVKTHYMGTVNNGYLNFYDGLIRVMDPQGNIENEFNSEDYANYISEKAVDWCYLKPTYLETSNGETTYSSNPLSRINVAEKMETQLANEELKIFRKKYGRPCHLSLMQHYARLIEIVYACEKSILLLNNEEIMGDPRTPINQAAKSAIAHIEAPRGILFHDYVVDDNDLIKNINFIIATQQNFLAINETIEQCASYFLKHSISSLRNAIEFSIRTFDPCLSCSTHAFGSSYLPIDIYEHNKKIMEI